MASASDSARTTGSASGASISATHSGSTSSGYVRHFMLVRRRSSASESWARGLAGGSPEAVNGMPPSA
jgi:hypothetical protein